MKNISVEITLCSMEVNMNNKNEIDPGFLRKLVFTNGDSGEEDARTLKFANKVAYQSGSKKEHYGYEGTVPTMFRRLSRKDFEKISGLVEIKHSGSIYLKADSVHRDVCVFIHKENVDGEFYDAPAISKFIELID